MPRALIALTVLLFLAGCAAPTPPLQLAKICLHPVSSTVKLNGAILTTNRCAD